MDLPGSPLEDVDLPVSVKRSVFAIHITPLEQKLTLVGRKLHIALAQMAGEQYQRLPAAQRNQIDEAMREFVQTLRAGTRPAVPSMLLQPQFFGNLKELAQAVGFEPSEARALMRTLGKLTHTPVRFNSLRHSAAKRERELYPAELEVHTALLSSVVRTGRGLFSWSYDPKILSIMVEPRTYALLNLELVRNARTYTALALYENTRRFVGIGRAGPYPFQRWQELLSPDGIRPKWEDNHECLRRIRKAIEELNACEGCDIVLEVERVTVADLGSCLQFKVRPLDQPKLPFGMPLPRNKVLFEALRAAGFSANEVRVMTETHGDEYLQAKLAMLEKAQGKSRGVADSKAWLRAAIERDFQDDEVQEERAAAREREREQRISQAQALREAFAAFQAQQLRLRFQAAPEDERAQWERAFAESAVGERSGGLGPTAKQGAFFGWLATQDHDLFRDPEELDLAAFAVGYATTAAKSSSVEGREQRGKTRSPPR
jgi:hypothetical protein